MRRVLSKDQQITVRDLAVRSEKLDPKDVQSVTLLLSDLGSFFTSHRALGSARLTRLLAVLQTSHSSKRTSSEIEQAMESCFEYFQSVLFQVLLKESIEESDTAVQPIIAELEALVGPIEAESAEQLQQERLPEGSRGPKGHETAGVLMAAELNSELEEEIRTLARDLGLSAAHDPAYFDFAARMQVLVDKNLSIPFGEVPVRLPGAEDGWLATRTASGAVPVRPDLIQPVQRAVETIARMAIASRAEIRLELTQVGSFAVLEAFADSTRLNQKQLNRACHTLRNLPESAFLQVFHGRSASSIRLRQGFACEFHGFWGHSARIGNKEFILPASDRVSLSTSIEAGEHDGLVTVTLAELFGLFPSGNESQSTMLMIKGMDQNYAILAESIGPRQLHFSQPCAADKLERLGYAGRSSDPEGKVRMIWDLFMALENWSSRKRRKALAG